MKINKIFYAFLFVALVLGFASCSDDEGYPVVEPPIVEPPVVEPPLVGTGSYILIVEKAEVITQILLITTMKQERLLTMSSNQ